jgi:hypothetical protein
MLSAKEIWIRMGAAFHGYEVTENVAFVGS